MNQVKIDKKQRQQRLLYFVGILGAIFLVFTFFILGGGSNVGVAQAGEKTEGLNTELPEVTNVEIAKNKHAAIISDEKRRMNEALNKKKQNSSFDLMESLSTPAPEEEKINIFEEPEILRDVKKEPTPPTETQKTSSKSKKTTHQKPIVKEVVDEDKEERERKERMEAEKAAVRKKALEIYGLNDDLTSKEEEKQEELKQETPVVSTNKRRGFKTMGDNNKDLQTSDIRAVIHEEQKNVTASSQVKLRLLDQIEINGVKIASNTVIYGKAAFSQNRMLITISNINYNNKILPFPAEIYDMDGFEGLYIPDNITNQVAKESSSSSVKQTPINVSSTTGIISTVLNSAVSTVQSATSSSIKEIKVDLPENYKLTIRKKK